MKFVKFNKDTPIVFVVEKPLSLPVVLDECLDFIKKEGIKEADLQYGDYLIGLDQDSDKKEIINEYDYYLEVKRGGIR